jgi:hypothetical protein
MKPKTILLVTTFVVSVISPFAQICSVPENAEMRTTFNRTQKKLNFFVISERKKGKIDPATRYNVLRTKIKSLVKRDQFVAIVASDADEASRRILYRLNKYYASIGTIWFDSHGMYKKGYSLFLIGHDEINNKTIHDSAIAASFERLVPYTTEETNVVIGSCYGGATYSRASIDYKDTTCMYGDLLMSAIGQKLGNGKVYASESWVMTQPGLFNHHKAAVAGYPKRKLFRDVCYRPAWENIGRWNEYNSSTQAFSQVKPVTLDSYGNLYISNQTFTDKKVNQKQIAKNMKNLAPDLYK